MEEQGGGSAPGAFFFRSTMVPAGFRGSEVCHPVFRVDDNAHMERDAAQIAVQRVLIEGAPTPADPAPAHPTPDSSSEVLPPPPPQRGPAPAADSDSPYPGMPTGVPTPTVTDDVCSICMGEKQDPVQPADCPHQFCRACILAWFRRTCACPMCKVPCRVLRWQQRAILCLVAAFCASHDFLPHRWHQLCAFRRRPVAPAA